MAKKENIERKWFVVDASGVPLGRLATRITLILRGKHKTQFTPHVDCGDYVIVVNASKVLLTGKKHLDKIHYHHSGYPGGLKQINYGELIEKKPEKVVELAVRRMLPKSRLGRKMLRKLKVYAGAEHPHAPQNPETFDLKSLNR